MKPTSHKGAGTIGVQVRHPSAAAKPAAAEGACRFTRDLSRTSAESTFALIAFAANRALTQQIKAAHRFGQVALDHAHELDAAVRRALPAGPLRDSLRLSARMQANAAQTVVAIADDWGRRFGHLAFAFAPPDRRD